MKIALPSTDKIHVADHFGRAQCFMLYDTDSKTTTYIDNAKNVSAAQGAGIQSASMITDNGAAAVISPRIGPKAFAVLAEAGIAMYELTGTHITIESAIESYNKNELRDLLKAQSRQ